MRCSVVFANANRKSSEPPDKQQAAAEGFSGADAGYQGGPKYLSVGNSVVNNDCGFNEAGAETPEKRRACFTSFSANARIVPAY